MINAFTKNITAIILGILFNVALLYFGVKPMVSGLSRMNGELTEKRNEVASLQQQIMAYQTAKIDLARATDKQKLDSVILSKEELVGAIADIESAAARTGTDENMTIIDPFIVKPDSAAPKPKPTVRGLAGVVEIPYTLSLKNDYLGTINFLSYLEHLPNLSEVNNFQLSAELVANGGKPVPTGQVLSNIRGVLFVNSNATP